MKLDGFCAALQAELVDSATEAAASNFSATLNLEVGGKVTAGVSKAAGRKCQRCDLLDECDWDV